jgi:hypothetical protein
MSNLEAGTQLMVEGESPGAPDWMRAVVPERRSPQPPSRPAPLPLRLATSRTSSFGRLMTAEETNARSEISHQVVSRKKN